MTQYVGLDVSLRETKLHFLDEAGNRTWRGRCATEAAANAWRAQSVAQHIPGVPRGAGGLFEKNVRALITDDAEITAVIMPLGAPELSPTWASG